LSGEDITEATAEAYLDLTEASEEELQKFLERVQSSNLKGKERIDTIVAV